MILKTFISLSCRENLALFVTESDFSDPVRVHLTPRGRSNASRLWEGGIFAGFLPRVPFVGHERHSLSPVLGAAHGEEKREEDAAVLLSRYTDLFSRDGTGEWQTSCRNSATLPPPSRVGRARSQVSNLQHTMLQITHIRKKLNSLMPLHLIFIEKPARRHLDDLGHARCNLGNIMGFSVTLLQRIDINLLARLCCDF